MDEPELKSRPPREVIETAKGSVCVYKLSEGVIAGVTDLLELIVNSPSDTVVITQEALTPRFFELRTGVAGEFLQKVANYRSRLVILGDFSDVKSNSLNALIIESNRVGNVVFAISLEEGVGLLK